MRLPSGDQTGTVLSPVKGKRVDQYIFGLLRDEWHAQRAKVRQ